LSAAQEPFYQDVFSENWGTIIQVTSNGMNEHHQHGHCQHGKDLQSKVELLERQLQEHIDGWKRAKADYINLKKQSEKEKGEIVQYAQGAVVLEFLPIYDNLKRAIQHIPSESLEAEWVKGITHILRQFEEALKSMNITPIATVGQSFDHTKHHAVSKVKKEGMKPDTIIEEIKSGFMAGDRVLEPAQVVVAE
jgi:molecular chaperone GrpE